MLAMTDTAHTVELYRETKRELTKINEQLDALLAGLNTTGRTQRGWTIDLVDTGYRTSPRFIQHGYAGRWRYSTTLAIRYSGGARASVTSEWESILKTILQRVGQTTFGNWEVRKVDGEDPTEQTQALADSENMPYAPCVLPDDWAKHFGHLYGLEPHIERVRRAIEAALLTDWKGRYHCALIGPPGCGKSDICQTVKQALGEESVLEFDATSTTMAGAQKELGERMELPRVILVEEIEKAPENALGWLLSVLDIRGNIRRVTARNRVSVDTKMLAIATVNDEDLFRKLNSGALASRFSNTIKFHRPNADTLRKILTREVNKLEDGDPRWVEATIEYCQSMNISDPRVVIATCLCGRGALLTGEYQEMMRATSDGVKEGWQ